MADGTHMYWLFYSCIPVLLGNVISRLIRLKKNKVFSFLLLLHFFLSLLFWLFFLKNRVIEVNRLVRGEHQCREKG